VKKIYQGSLMPNIVINMYEKFHYDRLRNDRALGNGKSDNNKNNNNNNNVRSHYGDAFPCPAEISYACRSLRTITVVRRFVNSKHIGLYVWCVDL